MARKNANTVTEGTSQVTEAEMDMLKEAEVALSAMTDEEVDQIFSALNDEPAPIEAQAPITEAPAVDVAQATAEANGSVEALALIAAEAPAHEEPAVGANSTEPPSSFTEMLDAVTTEQVDLMRAALLVAFGERARFENEADATNDNIQKTLSKELAKHQLPNLLRALVGAKVDANYVNVSEMGSKRRNVYALQKLSDLLYGAVTGHIKNAINLAVVTSLARLQATTLALTGEVAKACASDKTIVGSDYKGIIQRHTVAESTASTQASSTMTALEVLGVVTNAGTRNGPVYKLTETALAKRLVEIVTQRAPVAA